jgi:hypothetical protein
MAICLDTILPQNDGRKPARRAAIIVERYRVVNRQFTALYPGKAPRSLSLPATGIQVCLIAGPKA